MALIDDAQPGNFALYPDTSRVGMIVGCNAAGKPLVCHCFYGVNNVVVTEFAPPASPPWTGNFLCLDNLPQLKQEKAPHFSKCAAFSCGHPMRDDEPGPIRKLLLCYSFECLFLRQ